MTSEYYSIVIMLSMFLDFSRFLKALVARNTSLMDKISPTIKLIIARINVIAMGLDRLVAIM